MMVERATHHFEEFLWFLDVFCTNICECTKSTLTKSENFPFPPMEI